MSGPEAVVESAALRDDVEASLRPPNASACVAASKRSPRPHLPRKAYLKLSRVTSTYADSLKRDPDFAPAIQANLKGFRAIVQRILRLQFPLRRGRPPDPLLETACSLIAQGNSVPEVLRSQVPGFDGLDAYTRLLASKGLHQAYVRYAGRHNKRRRPRPHKASTVAAPQLPSDFNG